MYNDEFNDDDFSSLMKGMNAEVHIDLGWIRYDITQTFANTRNQPIEANYTFPIPSGAQLLSLTATLAEKTYHGAIQPTRQAQKNYDEAVTSGDSAIMVSDLGNGLLNCRLGNLLPNETASVHYVYLQPTPIANQRIRVILPTTIAPKYGNAHDSGMLPLDYPSHAAIAGYPFQLTASVSNALRDVAIESPSHPLKYQASANGVVLNLAGNQGMDRDFVLLLDLPSVTHTQAWLTPDQQGSSVMVSSIIRSPSPDYRSPVNIKLLVDCSGSMEGDSILKTKEALLAIMDQLDAEDRFSITRFGCHFEHFYPDLLPCDRHYKKLGKAFIDRIDADMGGTELQAALASCLQITDKKQVNSPSDMLLITDGQVDNESGIIELAAKSGQRVFVVGISSAVSEHFLSQLAQQSRGTASFIYPQEAVTPVISRMFERMRGDWVTGQVVNWSAKDVDWQVELPKTIYANDSLVFGARFVQAHEQISAHVSLTWKSGALSEIQCQTQPAPEVMKQDMPRLLVSHYIRHQFTDTSEQLAVDYQLLTPETAMFMRIERADDNKGSDDPRLVAIANPMPYTGILFESSYAGMPLFSRRSASASQVKYSMSSISEPISYYEMSPSAYNLVSHELFDGQDFDEVFYVSSLEEAHALISLLEAALTQLTSKDYRRKLGKKKRKPDLASLRDDLQSVADDKSYLDWDDEMLDAIYDELRESIENSIDTALDDLLSEMTAILSYLTNKLNLVAITSS
jgi:Ca-activated chloride channel family protein